eukprot:1150644-Pelagomonas_calceolata.AAC.1
MAYIHGIGQAHLSATMQTPLPNTSLPKSDQADPQTGFFGFWVIFVAKRVNCTQHGARRLSGESGNHTTPAIPSTDFCNMIVSWIPSFGMSEKWSQG